MKPGIMLVVLLVIASIESGQSILDTVASRSYFNLGQMIQKADIVCVAARQDSFITHHKHTFHNTPAIAPFEYALYHFKVLTVLKKPDSISVPALLDVHDAFEDLARNTHLTYHSKKMMIQPFVGYYRSSIPLDSAEKMVIFVSRHLRKGNAALYSFCLKNSWESITKKGDVVAAITRLKQAPDTTIKGNRHFLPIH
jgi:hypothetical protein